jgi:hypothetical protein
MRQGGAPNGKLPWLGLPVGRVLGRAARFATTQERPLLTNRRMSGQPAADAGRRRPRGPSRDDLDGQHAKHPNVYGRI